MSVRFGIQKPQESTVFTSESQQLSQTRLPKDPVIVSFDDVTKICHSRLLC